MNSIQYAICGVGSEQGPSEPAHIDVSSGTRQPPRRWTVLPARLIGARTTATSSQFLMSWVNPPMRRWGPTRGGFVPRDASSLWIASACRAPRPRPIRPTTSPMLRIGPVRRDASVGTRQTIRGERPARPARPNRTPRRPTLRVFDSRSVVSTGQHADEDRRGARQAARRHRTCSIGRALGLPQPENTQPCQ